MEHLCRKKVGDKTGGDGQQRLTTLMLMLRAFYTKFLNMKDDNSQGIRNSISKCIGKTDEFGNLKMDQLKIDSQVSTDDDKEEFMTILRTGEVKKEYHPFSGQNIKLVLRLETRIIQQGTLKNKIWVMFIPQG